MNDAKVTFSDDFKEKTKYKLSRKRKGILLNEKFNSLSLNQIKSAKSRIDIAKMLGYTEENISAGVTWVARCIKQGKLKESFYGYSASGEKENMYELPSTDPRYTENVKTDSLPKKIEENSSEKMSATIEIREDMKISIENITVENLGKLVNFLK